MHYEIERLSKAGNWLKPGMTGKKYKLLSNAQARANAVHFRILMAAAKSIQVVGWGTRGRSL